MKSMRNQPFRYILRFLQKELEEQLPKSTTQQGAQFVENRNSFSRMEVALQ